MTTPRHDPPADHPITDQPSIMARASRLAEGLAADDRLDRLVEPLASLAERLLADPRRRRLLHGEWLGHPAHPLFTDLPIGFWTSAFTLDLLGRRCTRTGDALMAAGIATAVPTLLTGLADWHERGPEERRIGAVHATANLSATVLYTGALVHRIKGNGVRGWFLGLAGATAATVGGYLGGRLAFGAPAEPTSAREAGGDGPVDGPVDPQGAALAALADRRTATG